MKKPSPFIAAIAALAFMAPIPAFAAHDPATQRQKDLQQEIQSEPITAQQTSAPAPAPAHKKPVKKEQKAAKHKAAAHEAAKKKAAAHKAAAKSPANSKKLTAKKPAKKAAPEKHKIAKTKAPVKPVQKEAAAPKPVPVPLQPAKLHADKTEKVEQAALAAARPAVMPAAAGRSGVKNVNYDFCIGYVNCAPHRFEMTPQGHHVLKASAGGNWSETKVDPVMEGDLARIAMSEPSDHVSRYLTENEKEQIADHQGKVHAQLVGDVTANPASVPQVKNDMRALGIRNISDLIAYDPKLGSNQVAVEAANQIATEHLAH